MRIVADFHGIVLLGTGDCTHPLWLAELQQKLKPTPQGLYEYQGMHFLLTTEVNNSFFSGGKGRRIHNVLFFPSIEVAQKANQRLSRYGDLSSDGVLRVRRRDLEILPGYDGEYGIVKIFKEEEEPVSEKQLSMF